MDTIPEPFALRNVPHSAPRRGGFLVPFGLRDGRVWAPGEVKKGKECGCICPSCGQALVAKAQDSRRRRAHFAHLGATDCRTGRETGIHLRAKQVIVERRELLLPGWFGDLVDMPNPPLAKDDEGRLHEGRRVDFPAFWTSLLDVEPERSFGTYRPDVAATDDSGELLIEIRVTHAVDQAKADRVQAHGRRMIEIDLSILDRHVPHDPAAFEAAVLFDAANRRWVSHPEALQAWQESKDELDQEVAQRNAWLAEQREAAVRALNDRAEQEAHEAKDKAGRRAYVRERERRKHASQLQELFVLANPERIAKSLEDYRVVAGDYVSDLLEAAPPAVRSACLRCHPDAWVFGVDPALWQLLAYQHFVGGSEPGQRFNQRDVASWVRRSFPYERTLYQLFIAQYAQRAEAQRAGFNKRRLSHWAFTAEENELIPNFYSPVNDFIDRLESTGILRKLADPIGECEVQTLPLVFHKRNRRHQEINAAAP